MAASVSASRHRTIPCDQGIEQGILKIAPRVASI
jgi:hypothetical protein